MRTASLTVNRVFSGFAGKAVFMRLCKGLVNREVTSAGLMVKRVDVDGTA
jgi:hypothetical protein